jgi:hypothetical protein
MLLENHVIRRHRAMQALIVGREIAGAGALT